MPVWKRWSWRYRLGALFALALLLQGAACPLDIMQRPTYPVPGINGGVIGELFVDEKGRFYYLVEVIGPGGERGFRRVYSDTAEYTWIAFHFGYQQPLPPTDRGSVPGGSGAPPLPPVQ